MNRRTTHTIAMLALASLGVLIAACEDEKKPAPPAPSATTTAAATVSASATAVALASASASTQSDTDDPDDTTADAVASDVTLDNYEKELESLDKEIATKY